MEGGAGGYDTVVFTGSYGAVAHEATGAESGVVTLDGIIVRYTGMEPIQFTQAAGTFTYVGTNDDDTITLSDVPDGPGVEMQIAGTGELVQFINPTGQLVIKGLLGNDTIVIEALDADFAADLLVYGIEDGFALTLLDLLGDADDDSVSFTGPVNTNGGSIVVYADRIDVSSSVSARAADGSGVSTADSGSISFNGRAITLATGSSLLAHVEDGSAFAAGDIIATVGAASIVRTLDVAQPEASISITGATIMGDAVELTADAAERFGVFGFRKDATARITLTDSTVEGNVVRIAALADTSLVPPDDVVMSGNPNLTFTHIDGGLDTIVRDDTISWFDDGFLAFQSITVVGTVENDGAYLIDSVSGNTLFLKADESVVDEGPVANVDLIGSLVLPDPENLIDLATPFTGSAIVTLSNATADVQVLGASTLTSVAAMSITARADSRATPLGFALAIPKALGIAAAWADSTATATALIGGTTSVRAGDLLVSAHTENETGSASTVMGRNKPVSLVFAGSKADSFTTASVGDATSIQATNVTVSAFAGTDTQAAATAVNRGASGATIAVALGLLETVTTARLGGEVVAVEDITVTSELDMVNNITESEARNLGSTGSAGTQLSNQLGQFQRDNANTILGSSTGSIQEKLINMMFPVIKSGKVNVSGAISYAHAANTVEASIAPDAIVRAGRDILVHGTLTDRNNIMAVGQTTSDGSAMGGAVAVTEFHNDLDAFIGAQAQVDAGRLIEVDAAFTNPFAWEDISFASSDELIDSIINVLDVGVFNVIFSSYVRNSSAGNNFGLAGAVEIRLNANAVDAYIGQGAMINQANGPDIIADPAQTVRVHARSEINGLHLIGEKVGWSRLDRLTNNVAGNARVQAFITRANGLVGNAPAGDKISLNQLDPVKNGVGGSVAYFDLGTSTRAWIADRALVRAAANVEVTSEALQRTILVAIAQGSSSKLGVHGAAGVIDEDSTTLAFIENSVVVNAGGDLRVVATSDPQIYNLVGGVTTGAATGIGASVSINDIDAVTRGFVGHATQLADRPTLFFSDATLVGVPTLRFEAVELSGAVTLTFIDDEDEDDRRDTITRSVGSWLTDGFRPGQMITIEGSDDNDGSYLIDEVTDTTITLGLTEGLADGTTQVVARRLMVGAAQLTFTDNESAADQRDTIVRSSGSWVTDGFAAGQTVRIDGAGVNDGRYVIDEVTATTLTLVLEARLVTGTAEGASVDTLSVTSAHTITRTTGNWLNDGFAAGQIITVSGTAQNDGVYTVMLVTADQITIDPNQRLVDETSTAVVTAPDSIVQRFRQLARRRVPGRPDHHHHQRRSEQRHV